jgi:integrase
MIVLVIYVELVLPREEDKKMAKRANGEGTIRKRKDGRWEGMYIDPATGKRHSIYGKLQKEVKAKLVIIQHEILSGSYLEETKMIVSEWFNLWAESYLGNVKPLTAASYRQSIKNHIIPYLGNMQLKKLKTNDIQRAYNDMIKRGLSAKTVKNVHGVIHKGLEKAIELNYINHNVSSACVLPRQERKEIKVMEDYQIVKFLQAIKEDEFESVYFMTLFTGMRQGEVLGLIWDDIDFDNNIIYIRRQLLKDKESAGYMFGSLKNGKSRTIVASQNVMNLLKKRKSEQEKDKEEAGSRWEDNKGEWSRLVFTNKFGKHLNHVTVYKHYKKIVTSIGIKESRFHDLRHSFAVISLQNGDDIKTVQENLGHHTAAFTLERYAHSTRKMKSESANRMDKYISEIA